MTMLQTRVASLAVRCITSGQRRVAPVVHSPCPARITSGDIMLAAAGCGNWLWGILLVGHDGKSHVGVFLCVFVTAHGCVCESHCLWMFVSSCLWVYMYTYMFVYIVQYVCVSQMVPDCVSPVSRVTADNISYLKLWHYISYLFIVILKDMMPCHGHRLLRNLNSFFFL